MLIYRYIAYVRKYKKGLVLLSKLLRVKCSERGRPVLKSESELWLSSGDDPGSELCCGYLIGKLG